jgi:hypothetical protein
VNSTISNKLSRVLSTLHEKERYRHVDLKEALQQCRSGMIALTKRTIEALESGATVTKELLVSIGGRHRDLRSAGWYGIIITDQTDAEYFKAYVGQTENLGFRIQQHIETVRQDPDAGRNQLLYHVWRKPGRKAIFVHLGVLEGYQKGVEAHELTLNIGEQLLAEVLQTLQVETMTRILPDASLTLPVFGLNVALPINQAGKEGSRAQNDAATQDAQREFTSLSKSQDIEVLEYYNENHHQFTVEQQQKGRRTMADTQHVQQIHGARQGLQNKTAALQRGPMSQHEEEVEVFCMKCRSAVSRHFDPAPLYEITTNQYVARRSPCPECPGPSPTKKAREVMVPYDRSRGFVRWNWVGKELDRNDPRWAHKRWAIWRVAAFARPC